jgi:hypothetical protein
MNAQSNSILRERTHTEGFTIMANAVLQDKRLSLRARGLIAYIFSLPDDWVLQMDHLQNELKEGRDAIRRAFRELEAAGFAELVTAQAEGGKFIGTHWVVREAPTEAAEDDRAPENPPGEDYRPTGKPQSGFSVGEYKGKRDKTHPRARTREDGTASGPALPASVSAPPKPSPPDKSRPPDQDAVVEYLGAYAREQGVNLDAVAEAAHWLSNQEQTGWRLSGGRGGPVLDWKASVRYWVGNEIKFRAARAGRGGAATPPRVNLDLVLCPR